MTKTDFDFRKNEEKKQADMDTAENKPSEPEMCEREILEKILKIVKPKETVTKALQRLGTRLVFHRFLITFSKLYCLKKLNSGQKLPAWKQKRLDALKRRQELVWTFIFDLEIINSSNHNKGKKAAATEESNEGNKQELESLTGLVDQLSRKGYYDIYSDPYEKIAFKLKQLNEKPKGNFRNL